MVTYECFRCGYCSTHKHHFLRHLRRKYLCPPTLRNISVEDVLRQYFTSTGGLDNYSNPTEPHKTTQKPHKTTQNRTNCFPLNNDTEYQKRSPTGPFPCPYCERKFSRGDSLKRHKDKFCKATGAIEVRLARKELELRLREVETPRQVNIGNTSNNTTNNTTTTNNQTINIKVLAYKDTDVSHLTDRDYQRAFNRASMCIPQILKKVHFDPEKPENHNVVISSMNNKYIKLHDGQKWNLRDREETIEDLFADAEDLLETKLESWQEEENPKSEKATRKYQIYLEVKEKAVLYNKIKQELKLLLFNSRNLVTPVLTTDP